MSADPVKIADTRAWLIKAARDITAAEQLFTHAEPLLDVIVYHCQQAAEKALKGYLFWHDIVFRRTHDLNELLHQCITVDPTLSMLNDAAQFLTPFAALFRYPGPMLEPPTHEAQVALDHAKTVFAEIRLRLPAEIAPAA
jgi:HEPN domain-containing protein